ncbi:MAG: hypothetical protein IAE94_04330 [Chthoniobacterales bacterium]|nr:hypothetical protein [Chthoniobacterales bacterium]
MKRPVPFFALLAGGLLAASASLPAAPQATDAALTTRVREAVAASPEPGAKMSPLFAYFVVPPMSNVKRTETTFPEDGVLGGTVRIIAARGEFEPASVVFFPFADAKKVEIKVSDLTGKKGKIPASAVDVKIVKIWYQTGLAWYSYFADTKGRELTPELLLNDETLIKVDRQTQDNYLRVDYPAPGKSEYFWISNPYQIQIPFNDLVEPVADAKTLQPFAFQAGEFKQLWLTFEAPKDAEGIYTGSLAVSVDGIPQGNIPLEVRVLPFDLPDPMTNYDIERPYYVSMYNATHMARYLKRMGGDKEQAYKRILNEYVNMRKHNLLYPILSDLTSPDEKEAFLAQLDAYKKAGLRTDTIFGGVPAIARYDWMVSPEVQNQPMEEQPLPYYLMRRVDFAADVVTGALGHKNIYCFSWDEPAIRLLRAQRLAWKYVHDKGLKVLSTGHSSHLDYAGYNEDFLNYGGKYGREISDTWHDFDGRVSSYAAPHTGAENPDFARRTHGFDSYMANTDGTHNYILNESPWNDFAGAEYNFRAFNMVYPTKDGPIDTLQWEGFREGIDDVRYATLLKQLANKAVATGKTETVYEGRKALLWLATQNAKTCDLNTLRLELIARILKLKEIL